MTTKEKLKKYADYKGISMRNFSLQIGVSDSFLRTKGSVYSDLLPVIRKTFADLDINWLLFDEGNMILEEKRLEVNEPSAHYAKETIESLKQTIEAKNETIEALKAQLNSNGGGSSKAS